MEVQETSRWLRSFAAYAAAIAIPAVALLAPAGGAEAATAQQAGRPAAATFSWHNLSLINGWQPYLPAGSRYPSYAVKGGVVYLSGTLAQPGGGSSEFAVLPKAARPAHRMYLTVYTAGGTTGSLEIRSNGDMFASSWPQSNARLFTSLAAISYPAPGATWYKLTLINGWKSAQRLYGTGDPAYAVIGGVVYLSGSLHTNSGTSTWFALLPAAARPAYWLFMTDYTLGGTVGSLQAGPSSLIQAYSRPASYARQYTSLAAISYPRTS